MKKILLLISVTLVYALKGYAHKIKLENESLLAVFEPSNGSLIKLINKRTNWNVIYREKLGQSFDMLVPLEWKRFHYIKGTEQAPPKIEATKNKITFTWSRLKSKIVNRALDITFIGTVSLNNDGLSYSGKVVNNDAKYSVEYIGWPYWGEMSIPDKEQRFVCESINQSKELHPMFLNEQGYWGVDYPTQSITLPESGFVVMRNDNQGIVGISDQVVPQQLVIISHELIPGWEYINPPKDTMDGQMVRIPFKVSRYVYATPGNEQEVLPFELIFYQGNPQKGSDLYKRWKENKVRKVNNNDWMKDPLTWQYVNISSAEELVPLAKECVKYGVSVLHINGWRAPDNQNYVKSISGLSEAIRKCQLLGVKVVLDLHINTGDIHSLWYKNQLEKYAIINMFGMKTDARMLCPLSQEMINIVKNIYAKNETILAADGIIINDNNNSGGTYFCFSTEHGHTVPAFVERGTYNLDRFFTEEVKKMKPEMKVFGFGFLDVQTGIYDGYRIPNPFRKSGKHRYINTSTPILSSIDERMAREDMNLCLKDRYNLIYNFSFIGTDLKNYPSVIKYGKEIESLRKKYSDFIWDGEFLDTLGVSVKGDNILYAVYKHKKDGRKAIIIINNNPDNISKVKALINNSKRSMVIASPEQPNEVLYKGNISINPLSAVLIMEK